MTRVFLGLGSNIKPEVNLRSGVDELRAAYGDIGLSPVYLAAAFGFDGADFHNMAVELRTDESIDEVVQRARAIEDAHGRDRSAPHYSSRVLDIDILLHGDTVCEEPIQLPRPDILRHAFVLRPLADIAGDVEHPVERRTLGDLWQSLFANDTSLRRLADIPGEGT